MLPDSKHFISVKYIYNKNSAQQVNVIMDHASRQIKLFQLSNYAGDGNSRAQVHGLS